MDNSCIGQIENFLKNPDKEGLRMTMLGFFGTSFFFSEKIEQIGAVCACLVAN
jgi:hypothetical protein